VNANHTQMLTTPAQRDLHTDSHTRSLHVYSTVRVRFRMGNGAISNRVE